MTRSAKRYVTDAALLGSLLGVDERAVLRNGDLLGRLVDTFGVSQLRPAIEVSAWRPRLHHLRLESGRREVDIVVEARDGRVCGIEIKANAARPRPTPIAALWERAH